VVAHEEVEDQMEDTKVDKKVAKEVDMRVEKEEQNQSQNQAKRGHRNVREKGSREMRKIAANLEDVLTMEDGVCMSSIALKV